MRKGSKKFLKSAGLFCERNVWLADLGTVVILPGSSGESKIVVVQSVTAQQIFTGDFSEFLCDSVKMLISRVLVERIEPQR